MASKEQSLLQVTVVGQIPKDWKISQIEDVTLRVCVGFVGSCFEDYCDRENGVPMIRTTNLSEDGLIFSDLKYVTKEFHSKNKKSQLAKGDIVVARHGDSGKACYYDAEFESNCLNIIVIRPDKTKCIPKFLLYSFRSPQVRRQIEASIVGSVQGVLNTKIVAKIKLALPRIEEQKSIADVLSNLDSKIIFNQKMNKTLEAVGQAVFKRWFVDFEFPNEEGKPYKSSGGEMPNSAMGEIPKGWAIGGLDDICEITMGQSPPGETYNETGAGVPFFQGVRDFGFRFPSRRIYCTAPTRFAEVGDVLLSVRAPVGSLNVAEERCAIGRGVAALHLKGKHNGFLYYLLLATRSGWEKYESEGTVFGSATKQDVHDFKIVIPAENLRDQFGELIEPLDKRILLNERESHNLTMIRDSLLPRLMSGKTRVPIPKENGEAQ
ncbi:MAG: restriction endonuclease subunit S [Candidatus Bathyarchaeia archaeon]|jgi:type I restriction enzyme S subunit